MLLKLQPCFKDYIWGGTKLKTDFGFDVGLDKLAEGWMLSCHKDGESVVLNGKYAGSALTQVIEKEGRQILGSRGEKFDFFPILIKLIDAKDDLSVQVHPDNDYALKAEGEYGKTECWYVLDCEEGAELIYGFKKRITADEFRKRIADNSFLEVVNKVKVKKGDFFFIEAGTLHAIGKGILLCEIQQNSNTTYRVYDYGRLGKDGKPRPLHVDKAVDVTRCEPPKYPTGPSGEPTAISGGTEQALTENELFSAARFDCESKITLYADGESFVSLVVIDGCGRVSCGGEEEALKKGDSVFISAGSGEVTVEGKLSFIKTTV